MIKSLFRVIFRCLRGTKTSYAFACHHTVSFMTFRKRYAWLFMNYWHTSSLSQLSEIAYWKEKLPICSLLHFIHSADYSFTSFSRELQFYDCGQVEREPVRAWVKPTTIHKLLTSQFRRVVREEASRIDRLQLLAWLHSKEIHITQTINLLLKFALQIYLTGPYCQ